VAFLAAAEVTAESLYEAVALGLRAIRQCSWVEDIGQNFTIRVLARDTPVEHTLEFRQFHKWLEQPPRSPREITARARVREIRDIVRTVSHISHVLAIWSEVVK
jgi:hypothetical protein